MNDEQSNELKKINGTEGIIPIVSNVFALNCDSKTYLRNFKSDITVDEIVGDNFCSNSSGNSRKIKINQNQNVNDQTMDEIKDNPDKWYVLAIVFIFISILLVLFGIIIIIYLRKYYSITRWVNNIKAL